MQSVITTPAKPKKRAQAAISVADLHSNLREISDCIALSCFLKINPPGKFP